MNMHTRPRRMHDTFTAWRQRNGGKAQRLECGGAILPDVLREAAAQCSQKDVLFILACDGLTGEKVLNTYVIRLGKREYRTCRETGVPKYFQDPKPDLISSLEVTHFAPVEPWVWTPGCDVVGIDRGLVEAR